MEAYTAGYLDNNLGFLVAPRPGAHLIHVALYINHGVKDEKPEENGISHLLEHILFNANRFPPSLAKYFEPLARGGASYDAWTSKEHTRICLYIAPEQLGATLNFLRELLQKAPLREETLEHERGIVLDEIARKRASNSYIWNVFEEALFAEPYGLSVLGKPDVIQNISLNYLKRRVKDILHPERVRIIVTGKVSASAVDTIDKHFGSWQGGDCLPLSYPVEIMPRAIAIPSASPRVGLYLGFPAPSLTDSERPAVEVLAQMLGSGMRSRIFRKLREEAGLAYAVGGGSVHWRQAGYIFLALEVAREKLTEGYKLLVQSIRELSQSPSDLDEISEAKQALWLRTLTEAENAGFASRLGLHWLAGEIYYPRQAAHSYKSVNTNLIAEAVQYLDVQRMALLGMGTSDEDLSNLLEVTP
ncbi:MAG: M16 family metallopeptidase [Trueperaceae bacterium]